MNFEDDPEEDFWDSPDNIEILEDVDIPDNSIDSTNDFN